MCVVLVPNIGISTSISNTTQIRPHSEETSCMSTRMCVVLAPNIGISTSIYNTTQIRPQHFGKVMCVHWECAWCQCQILVLATAYPTLHKQAHSFSETSCVSTGNVRGTSAKYWYQHQHIQHYTNTPTALQKLHVCPLGMCVVLVPNIGISTSISNTTQMLPQPFRSFMCVHWECAWCQCQILVLAPAYPTLQKYAHRTSERSCVSTGNVRGASATFWYQHQHIQHYTNTSAVVKKLHVCPLGMCVVLVPNIGISTSISNTTQIRPQQLRNFICYPLGMCVVLVPNIGISTSISNTTQMLPQPFRNFICYPLGMCVVLVPNIGISTSISNTTQIRPHSEETSCMSTGMRVVLVPNIGISTSISNTTQMLPQPFRSFMCVHWECAWCQCQILVLAPAYPTLQKYAHSTSERSCVSTGNVRGASAKYWYQHQHIQHYTNTSTVVKKLHVCPLGMCVVLVPNIGISTSISNTTQMLPQPFRNFICYPLGMCVVLVPNIGISTSISNTTQIRPHSEETSCMSTGMCVVLVPNIGISTSIYNTTQIRPQHFRKVMCVHWECAWCQCQILVLAPAYPTLHNYAHSTSERSCVSTGNVRGASAKYWYQHQHIQHYTYAPIALQKGHVCPLGMCVVLVPNMGLSTSISNTTQIRPQHFRNFMCVHWECAWCQCQILVLAPAYPTLHKYAHSTS